MNRRKVFITVFDGANLAGHCLGGAQHTGTLFVCGAEELIRTSFATD